MTFAAFLRLKLAVAISHLMVLQRGHKLHNKYVAGVLGGAHN